MNKTVVGGKKTGSHWKLLLTNRYCLYIVIRNERTTFLRPHYNIIISSMGILCTEAPIDQPHFYD